MNIDFEKLKSFLRDNVSNTYDLIDAIEDCEIKPDKCDDCARALGSANCRHCINYGTENNFKPKQNELDNLLKELDVIMEKIKCYHKKS